jgi:hypothetical protein
VPRNYTDEELKQQYGIHMATRLGADEEGKDKWADIDDDEDDWAPETVTWLDGTKSTVAATEVKPVEVEPPQQQRQVKNLDFGTSGERPRLQLQPQTQPQAQPQNIPQAQPSTPVLSITTSDLPIIPPSTSTKTILKPGSHALAQKGSGALGSKSSDKQNLLASGLPAPMPAKSPWASLPPVDKASPVSFVPPPSAQPQRFSRDPSGFDGFQSGSAISPKEIEADDFNRFYNQPRRRELFNSQSGEFEPANDARKGQPRHEHGHRQPAVLQRNFHGQPSPAEPSAAFQTSRAGLDGPGWQRHRTGSSGSMGRRMSLGRPQEAFSDRSETAPSLPTPTDAAPSINDLASIHSQNPQETVQSQGSESVSQTVNGQTEQEYMREKLEKARLAKQARLEEEEREEKARKERLRLKMEALAPAAAPSPPAEVKEKPRGSAVSVAKSPQTYKLAHVASPPKPPVPTAKGEIAQYGLMKVHQPHPVKNSTLAEYPVGSRGGVESRSDRRQPPHGESATVRPEHGPKPGSGTDQASLTTADQKRSVSIQESSLWRTAGPPEGFTGWGSSSSSNVWGPPQSKDRALGNGTFDSSGFRTLPGGAQAPRPVGTPAAFTSPGPIGPPSGQQTSQGAGRPLPAQVDRAHGPHGEVSPPNSLGHADQKSYVNQSPHHGQSQHNQFDHSVHDKMRNTVGGPVRQQNAGQDPKAQAVASGWNSGVKQTHDDNLQAQRNWKQHQQDYEFVGGDPPITPNYGKLGSTDARRAMLGVEGPQTRNENFHGEKLTNGTVVLPGQLGLSNPAGPTGSRPSTIGSIPQDKQTSAQGNPPLSQRSSRFFPRNETVDNLDKSDSPPPPETSSLDNGIQHESPRVKFPMVAIVKLPPALASSSPIQATDAQSPSSPGAKSGDWQSKFNTLFKKNASGAAALNASSRAPLDQNASRLSATVSIPARSQLGRNQLFSLDKSSNPQSRVIDEELYPQPEFGSTPTIRLPRKDHTYLNLSRTQTHYRSQHSVFVRQFREVENDFSLSKPRWETLEFGEKPLAPFKTSYIVRLSKDAEPKTVSPQSHSPRPHSGRGAFRERRGHETSPYGRGNRRPSGQYPPRDGTSGGSLRGNPTRGSYRGGNGHGSKRNITAPVVTAAPTAT